jgi:hypothetical protein
MGPRFVPCTNWVPAFAGTTCEMRSWRQGAAQRRLEDGGPRRVLPSPGKEPWDYPREPMPGEGRKGWGSNTSTAKA